MNETNGVIISKKTLIPISFVIVIIGLTLYVSKIQTTAEAAAKIADMTNAALADVRETYVTREILDLKLKPIQDGIQDIKQGLQIK